MSKKKRGFAAMSKELRTAIAQKGGKMAQRTGNAHRWTRAEAREMGRKGGLKVQQSGRAHRFTSETAALAARKANKKKRKAKDQAA